MSQIDKSIMSQVSYNMSQVMDKSAMCQARLVRSPGAPGTGGSLKLKVGAVSGRGTARRVRSNFKQIFILLNI